MRTTSPTAVALTLEAYSPTALGLARSPCCIIAIDAADHVVVWRSMSKESWATNARARNVMRANRGRDTKPELAVRRILHSRGLRYRVNRRPVNSVSRTSDIVFASTRVTVFIDGCYWHGCPEHYVASKSNTDYWSSKIANNRSRDAETNVLLSNAGWLVLRFWSHEEPLVVADVITNAIYARRMTIGRYATVTATT
jgi:DNA mismatch endonuclease (patch repair protein)